MNSLVEYLKDIPSEGEQINRHIFDNDWKQMYEDYTGETPEYQSIYDFVTPPIDSQDASKLVNKCYNKLYHLSSKENTYIILKEGLRCRTKDHKLTRIYCLAIPYKFKSEKFNEIINKFIEETNFKSQNYDLLEIDLNKQSSDSWPQKFYKDGYMKLENAIFTYHNIPAKYLRKLDYDL